jgi:hypothetical protein
MRAPSTKGFRSPLRLRLSPIRSSGSLDLDTQRTRSGYTLPPFIRFDHFMAGGMTKPVEGRPAEYWPGWVWRQGEHVTIIGPTGSGKTVLARQLLRRRDYVVILGVKNRDPELYGPFESEGYQQVSHFDPEPEDGDTHLLLVPRTSQHGAEARAYKREVFRDALNEVYDAGNWCVYADDIQYEASKLHLDAEFEELWMLGRSEGVSVMASSQEPVNIPVMAYGMATHLFLFGNPDKGRAERMGELTGLNREVTQHTVLSLPDHEFLYVNKNSRQMLRSMVIREGEGR